MRNFILAINRVKEDFINHKPFMILYLIGSVVCIIVFIYSYTNIPLIIQQYKEASLIDRTYTVEFSEKTEIEKSSFDFLENYNVESTYIQYYGNDENSKENTDIFSDNTKKNDIIGVTVVLKSTLSTYQNAEFIEEISKKVGGKYHIKSIISPSPSDNSGPDINLIVQNLLNISLMYIICFGVCACLFKHIFDSNRYENTIYSIVGSSKKRVFSIALIEAGILSLISIAIAFIIHFLLYDILFSKIYLYSVPYNALDYIVIAIFTLTLSIVTIIPFFVMYFKNPIIKTKRKL